MNASPTATRHHCQPSPPPALVHHHHHPRLLPRFSVASTHSALHHLLRRLHLWLCLLLLSLSFLYVLLCLCLIRESKPRGPSLLQRAPHHPFFLLPLLIIPSCLFCLASTIQAWYPVSFQFYLPKQEVVQSYIFVANCFVSSFLSLLTSSATKSLFNPSKSLSAAATTTLALLLDFLSALAFSSILLLLFALSINAFPFPSLRLLLSHSSALLLPRYHLPRRQPPSPVLWSIGFSDDKPKADRGVGGGGRGEEVDKGKGEEEVMTEVEEVTAEAGRQVTEKILFF